MNLILFETTDAVIEILWDIALAVFILRLAFIYFLLTFVSGAAMVYLAYTYYPQPPPSSAHSLATPQSGVALAPFLVSSFVLWAHLVVSRYEIPRVTGFRLATGAAALLFMVLADAVVGLGLWTEGYGQWAAERIGLGFFGLLAAFALMPTVLMPFEAKAGGKREKTWHGHEEKSIVDAV